MTERTKMIVEHLEGGLSMAALARRYGVSRKTAYKWVERYEQEQWAGLADRSRAPLFQPRAVGEAVTRRLVELKNRWPLWGAPKLHHKLLAEFGAERCPCEATVGNILRRLGLVKTPKRRVPATAPLDYGQTPNEVWCADFKGWFLLRSGRRCDPLTITDAASRYVLRCQALSETTGDVAVRPLFAAAFREYGLPRAMRTDNGPPFASSGLGRLTPLSVWWLKLGINLERIEPGSPGQNGRHERMHRELKAATQGRHEATLGAQQKAFDRFCREYNEERPHEALGFATPASVYQPSAREMPEKKLEPMAYSDDWERRQVRPCGKIKWKGHNVYLTRALAGERAGFEPAGDGRWRVWFGTHLLGDFDERKMRVTPPRRSTLASRASCGAAPPLRSGAAPQEDSGPASPNIQTPHEV